jgi:hypothetical protein
MVKRKSKLEEQPALDDSTGETLITRVSPDGAKQDRVVASEGSERIVGEHFPRRKKMCSPEGVFRRPHVSGITDRSAQNPKGLGSYFRANSVTGDNGDV